MIFSGKNEKEAIDQAVQKLNCDRQNLKIVVIQQARRGFFGIGKRPAKIKVEYQKKQVQKPIIKNNTKKVIVPNNKSVSNSNHQAPGMNFEQDEELANHRKNMQKMHLASQKLITYLTNVYRVIGVTVSPKITHITARHCEINLVSTENGRVIGYHGRRINAMERLGAAFLNYHGINDVRLILDTGDYRKRRKETLTRIMDRSITQVIATNRAVFLDPMPARERKYLHQLGAKSGKVRTYSHGREPFRSIVIAPMN